jgi:hypothetical protein
MHHQLALGVCLWSPATLDRGVALQRLHALRGTWLCLSPPHRRCRRCKRMRASACFTHNRARPAASEQTQQQAHAQGLHASATNGCAIMRALTLVTDQHTTARLQRSQSQPWLTSTL